MAFNNYYGNNPYNNNYQQVNNQQYPNQAYQPNYMQMQQPMNYQQPNFMQLVFVNDDNEVKNYIVAPNQTIYLKVRNTNSIYEKTANSQGEYTITQYSKEIEDTKPSEENKYAYQTDLIQMQDTLNQKIDKLSSELQNALKTGLNQARSMGAKFKDYTEDDFLTTYYMLMSDYDLEMLNSPQAYIVMAKKWLEDDDSELKGTEKLCAYFYEIVKAE